MIDIFGDFVDCVTDFSPRKCLSPLEENPGRFVDIYCGEKVVLCEDEPVRLPGICDYFVVFHTESQFGNVASPVDIVTQFTEVVDGSSLDVLVRNDAIAHQFRTSLRSVV